MMSLVSVCIGGEWLRVPRGRSSASVHELATGALRRFYQAKGVKEDGERKKRFSVQKCSTGEILLPDENVEEVLQDHEFLNLGMRGSKTSVDILISDCKLTRIHESFLFFSKVFAGDVGRNDLLIPPMVPYPFQGIQD